MLKQLKHVATLPTIRLGIKLYSWPWFGGASFRMPSGMW